MMTTDAVIDHEWSMMGGSARARVLAAPARLAELLESRGAELESQWSRFLPESDLSRLAHAEGAALAVGADTVLLLRAMREGWAETDRDFDPTMLPAVLAAGYGRSQVDPARVTVLPSSARARSDLDTVAIAHDRVSLPAGMALDPGGIGKGLAADLIAADLIARGAHGCLIEIGGDVRVAGSAPDGRAWRISVDDPFELGAARGIVRLVDGGIATSSQRKRRWTTESGADAHHLIDPHTQASAVTSIQTVTVIAATAARAEVLTKPGFLRPLDDYLTWIPTRGAAALLIDADGAEHTTSNWSDYA